MARAFAGRKFGRSANRLASEASKTACSTCASALDYCPPVNLEFGDYLRAIIADRDPCATTAAAIEPH
jgi:hypothetical protein